MDKDFSDKPMQATSHRQQRYRVTLVQKVRLTPHTFEMHLTRPEGMAFKPGQKITLIHGELQRDYSLIGSAADRHLSICIRLVSGGRLTPLLDQAEVGQTFQITSPFGFFLYQSSERKPVFVATGTGIAPFVAFARSGVRGFFLLHGVRSEKQLYYRDELRQSADTYLPCISGISSSPELSAHLHFGRTTDYLKHQLAQGRYDFYLCGRSEMVRDATRIIDRKFTGSRVFTEIFY